MITALLKIRFVNSWAQLSFLVDSVVQDCTCPVAELACGGTSSSSWAPGFLQYELKKDLFLKGRGGGYVSHRMTMMTHHKKNVIPVAFGSRS